jgi:hypothetical protein
MDPQQQAQRTILEKEAFKRIDAQMHKATRSAFTSDGRLKHEDIRPGQVTLGEYLDLAGIDWAPDPYGADHCQWLSRLVDYMSELTPEWGCIPGGPLKMEDRKILHCVAMLYTVGRKQGEEGYAARSAAFADKYLREGAGAGTAYWSKDHVREEICRLIYKHNDPEAIRSDKRLQVFADACRYELVRIAPNTPVGTELLARSIDPSLFYTGWARSGQNFRAWMVTRGWK